MKINIQYGNLYSQILTQEIIPPLYKAFSVRSKDYFWIQKKSKTGWDGYYHFINKEGVFLTGLIYRIKKLLEKYKHTVSIIGDLPNKIEFKNLPLNGIILREDQIECIKACLSYGRGIDSSCTNAGKAEIISSLVQEINKKTLILVNGKNLFDNIYDRIKLRLNIPVGSIKSNVFNDYNVNVGMVQSIESKLYHPACKKYLNSIELLIVDEVHFAGSATFQKVLKHIPADYKFGFSGTPFNDDLLNNLKIESIFGKVIFKIKNKTLIDMGISAKPEIRIINNLLQKDVKHFVTNDENKVVEKRSYLKSRKKLLVVAEDRNILIKKICEKEKKGILILVQEIDHGRRLQMIIPGSKFVDGSSKNVKKTIEKFDNGEIPVLIGTKILNTGVSINNIFFIIIASGLYGNNMLLQKIGRGLRKKENNNKVIIYDFSDTGSAYLSRQSKIRQKHYEAEKFNIIKNYKLE